MDKVTVAEVEDPGKPRSGEIRVALKAGSLNYHDLLIAMGKVPKPDGRILLSDGAGIVEEVGAGVTAFQLGDHVVSTFLPIWEKGPPRIGNFKHTPGDGIDGMAAEYVVRPVSAFTHAPRSWSFEEASTITTSGLTAWRGLVVDGGLQAGQTVLVEGTGGVSITALQLAKAMGARVIATSSSDEKLKKVKELGADFTINYKKDPKWGETAYQLSKGGVDIVIEVGGPATVDQAVRAVKVGGHIAQIGVLTGQKSHLSLMPLIAKQACLKGLMVGSRQHQKELVRALETLTNVKPVIDKTFSFEELAEAFRYQKEGRHFGKIAVSWESNFSQKER